MPFHVSPPPPPPFPERFPNRPPPPNRLPPPKRLAAPAPNEPEASPEAAFPPSSPTADAVLKNLLSLLPLAPPPNRLSPPPAAAAANGSRSASEPVPDPERFRSPPHEECLEPGTPGGVAGPASWWRRACCRVGAFEDCVAWVRCWFRCDAPGEKPTSLTPNVCCWNNEATARCKSPLHVATASSTECTSKPRWYTSRRLARSRSMSRLDAPSSWASRASSSVCPSTESPSPWLMSHMLAPSASSPKRITASLHRHSSNPMSRNLSTCSLAARRSIARTHARRW
mmetsp:Transcript_13052/g.55142  ORF Transcript_13052/g.55142 Transcript_13052/m.55142 type:complete len:284 (+) Transcript_13052:343-1194(+)